MENQMKSVLFAYFLLKSVFQSSEGPQNFGAPFFNPHSFPFQSGLSPHYSSIPPSYSLGTCGDLWSYQTDDFGSQIGIVKIQDPHWQSSYVQVILTVAAQLHQVSDSNLYKLLIIWLNFDIFMNGILRTIIVTLKRQKNAANILCFF